MSPSRMPFAPTCSRNHADGTLPSMIALGGSWRAMRSGRSASSRFLKILPAHFIVGGYFLFQKPRRRNLALDDRVGRQLARDALRQIGQQQVLENTARALHCRRILLVP